MSNATPASSTNQNRDSMAENGAILRAIEEMPHCNESAPRIQPRIACWVLAAAVSLLAGCETPAPQKSVVAPPATPRPAPEAKPPPVTEPAKPPPPAVSAGALLRQATWEALPDWREENPAPAWGALIESCGALRNQDAWRNICTVAAQIKDPDPETARRFFEFNFTPYRSEERRVGKECRL